MIPKIIHYCWFGGKPLPKSAEKCIASWKKYLPDYDIKRWDESNFDVNAIPYTREAYAACKYAFVSDYARFWILYHYGGVYFDTDVEVIRPIDDIINRGGFLGVESNRNGIYTVNPGLGFAATQGTAVIGEMINLYSTFHFINTDGALDLKNIVEITTEYLSARGLRNTDEIQQCCGFTIYPKDYFCPIDYDTRELKITENTRTIHHYAESWVPRSTRFKNALSRLFGKRFMSCLVRIKRTVSGNAKY
ncbi:MAG: glycosyltransferase [Clostridiales bacterium]|nr:glycosyltransferase [Clostridiales bacterium]MDY4111354.1 glycosyltransferase [Roseburia sp.]